MTTFTSGDKVRITATTSSSATGFVGMTGVVTPSTIGGPGLGSLSDVYVTPDTDRPDIHTRAAFWWPSDLLEKIEVVDAHDRVAELERQLAAAQETARRASDERQRAEDRLEGLKRSVAVKVRELAKEHGWCHVVNDGLRDVGIQPVIDKYRITFTTVQTITREWTIVAECTGDDNPDESYVRSSLSWDGEQPELDGDWDVESVDEDTYASNYGDVEFDDIAIVEEDE